MSKKHIKHFFIPHADNEYHPHMLHTKRAVFYSAFFFVTKIFVVGIALLIPSALLVSPDILAKEEQSLVRMTNAVRVANGVQPLVEDERLYRSAGFKTRDMIAANYFGHSGPDGHDLAFFLSEAGYRYKTAGENLAMGYQSAEETFAAWLNSPSHYQNIIDPDFKELGVHLRGGEYDGRTIVFAASHFGTPNSGGNVQKITQANDIFVGQMYELDADRRAATRLIPGESSVSAQSAKGQTMIDIRVRILGTVQSATATVQGVPISLVRESGQFDTYVGSAVLDTPYRELFRTASTPMVRVVDQNGDILSAPLVWEEMPSVAPSFVDRYRRVKTLLSSIPLFSVSSFVYLVAALLFAIALLLKVFVHINRQHAHVIVQTLCLIFFLVTLALV